MAASPALQKAAHDEPSVMTDADAGALFDRLGASPLVAEGKALLVSIAPIKAALGARWESRRGDIYEVAERQFRRRLDDDDICERASETSFLIATPAKPSMVAQSLCYRALKEVLTHFLGAAEPAHVEVSRVTALTKDLVSVDPISPADLARADAAVEEAAARRGSSPAAPERPSIDTLKSWPLTTSCGRNLHVSFAVDPVIDLKSWRVVGHRVDSRILDTKRGIELTSMERRGLLPPDFERIDLAALNRGMAMLSERDAAWPSLIVQMSFVSISSGRARSVLFDRARECEGVMRQAVICELVDIEPGLPFGRLQELIALAKPFFRGVVLQVDPHHGLIEAGREAGAKGVTVPARALGGSPEAIARGLRRFMKMALGAAPMVAVNSLPTRELLIDAQGAGFSHATLRIGPGVPRPVKAEADDLHPQPAPPP